MTFDREPPESLLIQQGFSKQLPESSVLLFRQLKPLHLRNLHAAKTPATGVKGGVGNGVLTAKLTGRNPVFGLAEDTDDLFAGKCPFMGEPHMAYEDITNIKVY